MSRHKLRSRARVATASLWLDDTDRFPDDHFLRAHGWSIAERPKTGPAVWWHRGGKMHREEREAIAHVVAFIEMTRPKTKT